MTIQGNYAIEASSQDVWTSLMDPDVLKRITPGISELDSLGNDTYKAVSKIKLGPVKASFEGQLELLNKIENTAATIRIDQKSKIGNVQAEIQIKLNPINNTTEIDYNGEAKMTGKLAVMGQRILGGVVSSLSKQFFNALNNEIHSH